MPTTYSVSNASALNTALAQAVGGDRIVLARGDYGAINITNRNYASNVTLISAGAPGSAHLDSLNVRNSSNLTFQFLDIGRGLEAGEADWTRLNSIRLSTNIRMLGVTVHGSEDGNYNNDGLGLIVADSNNVRVEQSTFTDLTRGLYIERSNNTMVGLNTFTDLRVDGINAASARGLFIHGNVFRDFHPLDPDHADGIQLWNTNQTYGSSNVSIRDNVIWMPDQGDRSGHVQGIWISDPFAHGYQNVQIRNNLVYTNDAYNGITVKGGRNVQIDSNTVVSRSGDREFAYIWAEGGSGVTISNNVSEAVILDNVNPTLINNMDLYRNPGLRGLFPDLDTPGSIDDLITVGIGFQRPVNIAASVSTLGINPPATAGQVFVEQSVGFEIFDKSSDDYAPVEITHLSMSLLSAMSMDSFTALP